MHTYDPGDVLRLELRERHRLIGLQKWGVIVEIWQHTNAASPSDECDIVRLRRLRPNVSARDRRSARLTTWFDLRLFPRPPAENC